jgi:K+-sensing histidine kinase KdpD
MRPGAVVADKLDDVRAGGSPLLAVHLDVGVAKAIDRLELVADQEQPLAGDLVDQLALQAVGVLELVHHDLREPLAVALGHFRQHAQKVTGA